MSNPFYQTQAWKELRAAALARDGFHCTVPGCHHTRQTSRLYVDHRIPRPYSPNLTSADVLSNLRTLCESCDNKIRQDRKGERRSGGKPMVPGCDASGVPLDPSHHWRART